MGARKTHERNDRDTLGPGAYLVKDTNNAPERTFGSRFDTDIRSRDHLQPRKKDGPGPGSYVMPSSFKVYKPKPDDKGKKATSWGKAHRDAGKKSSTLTPGPNAYHPSQFTEASHEYSFPKTSKNDEAKAYKASIAPGPGAYEIRKEDKQEGTAKSFLGGPLEFKGLQDNGVPGPGSYHADPRYPLPGFRIVPHTEQVKDNMGDDRGQYDPVGPQKYDPMNPAAPELALSNKGPKISPPEKEGIRQAKFYTPAPNNYPIKSDFEKAIEKPRFHMGIKTGARTNKNLDMPGPGEYETDVLPLHHSNLAHVIGTSVRSDLGVGKAHMQPGPGEYDHQETNEGPRVGFGT